MRTFAPLAFATVTGVVLWKLFATVLLPMLAVMLGLVGTALKFALIGAVIFLIYSMIRKRREEAEV
jgi:4-hydroxybenzoate polyprenyltransferase